MSAASPSRYGWWKWHFGVFVLTLPGVLAGAFLYAHAACDPLTDNCASVVTSVSDDALYSGVDLSPTFTFSDNSCTSAACLQADSATALHGTVTNSDNGTFTYVLTDNTYSGPETITYLKGDGTTGTVEMTVCAIEPCTIGNPTAQFGTYAIVDNALTYTPDVTRFGQPLTDNLAYTITDKNGRQTTVTLTYVYPTFSTSGVTETYTNAGPAGQTFRHVLQGTGYDRHYGGTAWFSGDAGANGGPAHSLVMSNGLDISTSGNDKPGIEARSLGGDGQGGEDGGTRTFFLFRFYGTGGAGGWGGGGGDVVVNNTGDIVTNGSRSHGIWAMSRGGAGGDGGDGSGAYSSGGSGAPGGPGGAVTVNSVGDITTLGDYSDGIRAESLAGQGGRGGNSGGIWSTGGNGSFGVSGGAVRVDSAGDISTGGFLSHGIFAQSIGGGGGNGGDASGLDADAGDGGGAGNGGTVTVDSAGSIATSGNASDGIFAQGVGGGGGGGGDGAGWFATGGGGVAAGDGNAVSVTSAGGAITTSGSNSNGIFAQSVGGGGGGGGSATAVGAFVSIAVGGDGGDGGDGAGVTVSNASDIHTFGDNSVGIIAQSVGGGGGAGGYSIAGSIGAGISASLAIGGDGAGGGNAGAVSVTNSGAILTDNTSSHGIFAQSNGGGGGKGGFSIAAAISNNASLSLAFGGSGGSGGTSAAVSVSDTGGLIRTLGEDSTGIFAQSVGGGGGAGGFSIAGGISGGASLNFSMAGTGGAGGKSGTVSVSTGSDIHTTGEDSHAVFAQSLGGGGGAGGFSVTGGISGATAIGASVGGAGGGGAAADNVTVSATGGTIRTSGSRSHGIFAQSVGGGGGAGGFSVAGGLGAAAAVNFAMGGGGGAGSTGGTVSVSSASNIITDNNASHGIFAQSVGGGGGAGGFSATGGISGQASIGASVGGSGGSGGVAGDVSVTTADNTILQTSGGRSYGILAQSTGGSGGDGGFSVAGGIAKSASVNFAMGGDGGGGGVAGAVSVDSGSSVWTYGDDSHGIFAQSVGGGGGSGGFSVTGGVSADAAVGASIGGDGGGGARADNVTVRSTGAVIRTYGERAHGIFAQSVGGSGGDGGFSVAGGISKSAAVNFAMGGDGGNASAAGDVTVDSAGSIATADNNSHGIFAQSVGGSGGSGGFSVTAGIAASGAAVGASIGGDGGNGGAAGDVSVATADNTVLQTSGWRSHGILAQSMGGSGGDGGFSVAVGISKSASVNFSMGGDGGTGAAAGAVSVDSGSSIWTFGDDSHGIFAQSVGGGGGSGGFSVAGSVSVDSAGVSASIGGGGGDGASSDNVVVRSAGAIIQTSGDRSYGILAQSVGGTGGDGGFSVAGAVSKSKAVTFSLGGSGGTGSTAGDVELYNASSVSTLGSGSHALYAQSLGGSGGSGGFSVAASVSADNSAAAAVGVSIGGFGAGGGDAGSVTVASTGEIIETSGERSYGILAQSVGGGGGDGGFSVAGVVSKGRAVSFSLGGGGGEAGGGGTVEVQNTSGIVTHDNNSHGIFAQSAGGGGGSGGFSVAGSVSADNNAAAAVGISIGGFGAGGGNADNVLVGSSGGAIRTEGYRSYGILAQSVGGGGGDGGFSVAGGAGKGGGATFSLGGYGDTGGNAGAVEIGNSSDIITLGDGSHAIYAESTGGGGGSGGFSIAGSMAWDNATVTVGISVGGSGDKGGNGGAVSVASGASAIFTAGDGANGIYAESVGGGGGNGSFSVAGALGADNTTKNVSVSIGGGGGDGGFGGEVSVVNSSSIVTTGNYSEGIVAQSVGGGGGSGGFSVAGSLGRGGSKNFAFSLGGAGGDGNYAGDVFVDNDNTIRTYGYQSHGIYAQSLGGGGGKGGWSVAADIGSGGDNTAKNVNVSVGIGGGGGDGSYGGDVTVVNRQAIVTGGAESHGIFAQSLGGGGGNGGASFSGLAAAGANDNATNISVAVSVGGGGGNGSNGGSVVVENHGDITALDNGSHGIFAQSVGGGGGNGGNASNFSVMVDTTCPIPHVYCRKQNSAESENDWSFSVAVGGDGGGASDGGTVDVANSGNIVTRGVDSAGIFAQSIGGGGGNGGNGGSIGKSDLLGTLAPESLDFLFSTVSGFKEWDVMVGGSGGSSGNGDNVAVRNSGNITTYGSTTVTLDGSEFIYDNVGSYGIFAQSIGGGGGTGGNASTGLAGKIGIGGASGASGSGGAVAVESSGRIETFGDGGHAILAQSGGGGGGTAGDVQRFKIPLTEINIGLNAAFGREGGGGGDGGAVTVSNTGTIVTHGANSFGILAQSFGGGGGIAADVGFLGILIGSVGGDGSGGAVTVSHTGGIYTYGASSHGIFAQSAGGTDNGDRVDIAIAGNVITYGDNSTAVFAQSRGDAAAGNITIRIDNGIVQGGSGEGYGVQFSKGAANTLTNRGTVTTADGISGTAVAGTNGKETVYNYGTIIGSVDLGAGSNAFHNEAGGTVYTGAKLSLGSGNTFTNHGTLSIGESGVVRTTTLAGNLAQAVSGTLLVDLDLKGDTADRFVVDGAADMAGRLAVTLVDPGWVTPGTHRYAILSGADNVVDSGISLAFQPSAAVEYGLSFTGSSMDVAATVDFSPQGKGLTGNQRAIGRAVNAIQQAGGTTGFAPLAAKLVGLATFRDLAAAYDQLSPERYDAGTRTGHEIARQYTQTLLKRIHSVRMALGAAESMSDPAERRQWLLAYRGADAGVGRLLASGQGERGPRKGVWMDAFGMWGGRSGEGDYTGYDYRTFGTVIGVDSLVSDRCLMGFGFGQANTGIDLDDSMGSGHVDGTFGSLYGSWFTSRMYIDMALSYGSQSHENERNVAIDNAVGTLRSGHRADVYSAYAEGGYNFRVEEWILQPYAYLQYVYLDEEGFTEAGMEGVGLQVQGRETGSLVSELGVRLERVVPAPNGFFLPGVSVAWNHDFGLSDRAITSSFTAAPGTSFSVQGRELEEDGAVLGIGLTYLGNTGMSGSLKYSGGFRRDYVAQGIYGELRYEF